MSGTTDPTLPCDVEPALKEEYGLNIAADGVLPALTEEYGLCIVTADGQVIPEQPGSGDGGGGGDSGGGDGGGT